MILSLYRATLRRYAYGGLVCVRLSCLSQSQAGILWKLVNTSWRNQRRYNLRALMAWSQRFCWKSNGVTQPWQRDRQIHVAYRKNSDFQPKTIRSLCQKLYRISLLTELLWQVNRAPFVLYQTVTFPMTLRGPKRRKPPIFVNFGRPFCE